jgi:hypothetical protein
MLCTFDVFKGSPKRDRLWLGNVEGLQRAIDLMNSMAGRLPGDYFMCNAATQELVALVQNSPIKLDRPTGGGSVASRKSEAKALNQ